MSRRMNWVIGGGDDGFARIYQSQSGQFLQGLNHGNGMYTQSRFMLKNVLIFLLVGELVQTVTVSVASFLTILHSNVPQSYCDCDHSVIVTASSTIKIWVQKPATVLLPFPVDSML